MVRWRISKEEIKMTMYVARMNSWVHDNNYPVSKTFRGKKPALDYIKKALAIYPYVKITLYKYAGGSSNEELYYIDRQGKIKKK